MKDIVIRFQVDPARKGRHHAVSHCCCRDVRFVTMEGRVWVECSFCENKCNPMFMGEQEALRIHQEHTNAVYNSENPYALHYGTNPALTDQSAP